MNNNPDQVHASADTDEQKKEESFAACPSCSKSEATRVEFTWWGGLLGPKLYHHVKCGNCGTTYNGVTGKSNVMSIIRYSIIANSILIAIIVALWFLYKAL